LVLDIEVHPSVEGIRAARDEVLERALAALRTGADYAHIDDVTAPRLSARALQRDACVRAAKRTGCALPRAVRFQPRGCMVVRAPQLREERPLRRGPGGR